MNAFLGCIRPSAVAAALLAFAALLFTTASPSAASPYSLTYSGQVTSTTGVFDSMVSAGDVVGGSVGFENFDFPIPTYEPPKFTHGFYQYPMPSLFHVKSGTTLLSFDESIGHGSIISELNGTSTLALTAYGSLTTLTLFYETSGVNPPLFTLAGLTDWGKAPGLLPGPIISLFGTLELYNLGSVTFSIDLPQVAPVATTPIPAALPLFLGVLGGLGLFGWRRRRQPAA
jgi:MYXO-CTERM domain-containing protein